MSACPDPIGLGLRGTFCPKAPPCLPGTCHCFEWAFGRAWQSDCGTLCLHAGALVVLRIQPNHAKKCGNRV